MFVALRANWQGLNLTLTIKILKQRLSMGKQHKPSWIANHFSVSLHFFCNDSFLF